MARGRPSTRRLSASALRPSRYYTWSELLRRVFALDVLECTHCGSRLRILSTIHPPDTPRRILEHLGLPARAPPIAAAAGEDEWAQDGVHAKDPDDLGA